MSFFLHQFRSDFRPTGKKVEATNRISDLSEQDYLRRFSELRKVLHGLWRDEKRIDCIKVGLLLEVDVASCAVRSPRACRKSCRATSTRGSSCWSLICWTSSASWSTSVCSIRPGRSGRPADSALCPSTSRWATRVPVTARLQAVDVLEKTRVVARNWFGKVSELKEVVPRIYSKPPAP